MAENVDPDRLMSALFKALPAEPIAYMRERERSRKESSESFVAYGVSI